MSIVPMLDRPLFAHAGQPQMRQSVQRHRPEDMAHTRREARALSDALAPKGLAIRVIDVGDGRALCYLYRPGQLRRVLAGEKESRLPRPSRATRDLTRRGRGGSALRAASRRAARFRTKSACFWAIRSTMSSPFIANKGRNCLCCGCWKCYTDACSRAESVLPDSASAPASISACSPAEGRSISWP